MSIGRTKMAGQDFWLLLIKTTETCWNSSWHRLVSMSTLLTDTILLLWWWCLRKVCTGVLLAGPESGQQLCTAVMPHSTRDGPVCDLTWNLLSCPVLIINNRKDISESKIRSLSHASSHRFEVHLYDKDSLGLAHSGSLSHLRFVLCIQSLWSSSSPYSSSLQLGSSHAHHTHTTPCLTPHTDRQSWIFR